MAIQYVGGRGAGRAGATSTVNVAISSGLTGGIASAASVDDLCVVTVSVGTAARQPALAITAPAGFTALTAQRTTATALDANVQTCYKKLTAGDITAGITIPSTGNIADGQGYTIQVFRGVDLATPMDATATYATGSGTNNRPDGAAITPVTTGAWILACGGGAAGTGTTVYTAPAGFATGAGIWQSYNGADTNDGTVGAGHYTGWTSGAYDPAVFGAGNANAANSWGCTTLALRPAAGNVTGTMATTLGGIVVAVSGSVTISGTLAATLGGVTLAGAGVETISGTQSVTLGGVTFAGVGVETITGTASATLGGITFAGVGEVVASDTTGTMVVTLGGVVFAGIGTETITGSGSITLDGISVAASGIETITGTQAVTLDGIEFAGDGELVFAGTVAVTLGGITFAGIGEVPFILVLTNAQALRLEAIFRRHGLIDPLVITPTSISDGTLTMTRAWDGTTETDTVTALPSVGVPTAALVDKLARHYGLIDPVEVTATSRTDGTLSQTISEVGTTITVTP